MPSALAVIAGLGAVPALAVDYNVPPNLSNGISLTGADRLYVAAGATVTNTSGNDAVSGSGATLIQNAGTIAGSGSNAAAVDITGDVSFLTNSGLLAADTYNVVYIHGRLVGSFTNTATGLISSVADDAVRITDTVGAFTNFGTIRNTSDDGSDGAVQFDKGITLFNNTNLIEADGGAAVVFGGGITGTGTDGVFNSGDITSTANRAIEIRGVGGKFTNEAGGTISGVNGLIYNTSDITASATVVNAGTIIATSNSVGTAIALTGNADSLTLETTSVITGLVDGGGGTDHLIFSGASGSASFEVGNLGWAYTNFENFSKTGGSTWTLTGTNTATMDWLMDAGILNVNATMANTNFALSGGTLAGTGTVGDVELADGATISPGGNSIGTLTVADLMFASGSIYAVDLSGNSSDRIVVTGDVDFSAGPVLTFAGSGASCGNSSYTVMQWAGTRTGDVGDIIENNSSITLSIVGTTLQAFTSNGTGRTFTGYTDTANQAATAAALDALGCGNQPYANALNALTDAEVPEAMDALSGEGHASIATAMVENASHIEGAVSNRLDQAFGKVDSSGAVSSFAGGSLLDPGVLEGLSIWGDAYGGVSQRATDGNAAALQSASGGVLFGVDGRVTDDWVAGLFGGFGISSIHAGATDGRSLDATVGGYAGGELGVVTVKGGAAYQRHFISTSRSIIFPGINDVVSAAYQAGTMQGFVEVSTDIDAGAVTLTPFARLQGVSHHTDAFTETGGEGSLDTAAGVANALFVTLGIGAEHQFVLNDTMLVTARGSIGWRHAFAEAVTVANSFAGGGPFSIASAGIASDVVLVSAGASVDIDAQTSLDIGIEGALGSGYASQAVKLTLSGRF